MKGGFRVGAYRYIRIQGEKGKDPDLFQRLMSLPEMVEVLMEDGTPNYVATVDEDALSGPNGDRELFRKLMSVKGVRNVAYHECS